MTRSKIKQLVNSKTHQDTVLIKGWVKTRRDSKGFSFLEINDGSCLKNIQVIADSSLNNYEQIKTLSTGSAVMVTGKLVKSPGGKQNWEIQTDSVEIIGAAPESYPLQKKRH
ncbi:MAG: asparagine--tRNA ligase, partial [Deltaproteobacteria bacterium]|nr:asparagine--tRNA ligase [Deltaproteobacteria bacterium]